MVSVRSEKELEMMRKSGWITAQALSKVLQSVQAGVSCLELDQIAQTTIEELGGKSSFKTVKGYNWTSCITINKQVVHGIPTQTQLKEGDIVSIDLGTVFKGWHSDAAWTILVQSSPASLREAGRAKFKVQNEEEKQRFLKVGEEALWDGISQAVEGKQIGDISSAIQGKVEGAGYSVVRALVGHGIGRALHEEPAVPGFGSPGSGLVLKAGMSLAIEVIYTMGGYEVILESDGWTYSSVDKSLASLFEMTVAVGKQRAEVLTNMKYLYVG